MINAHCNNAQVEFFHHSSSLSLGQDSPRLKDVEFTLIYSEENQAILTFEKLRSLKND